MNEERRCCGAAPDWVWVCLMVHYSTPLSRLVTFTRLTSDATPYVTHIPEKAPAINIRAAAAGPSHIFKLGHIDDAAHSS